MEHNRAAHAFATLGHPGRLAVFRLLMRFAPHGVRATTVEEVNALFATAAEGPLKGILGFETRPLVSCDFTNDPRSSIVDGPSTMVINGTQVEDLRLV